MLGSRAVSEWRDSIVRRSLLLQGLYSFGFLFNFGTIYSVNRLLEEGDFGIFYFSYTIVLVLIAFVPMVNLYLSAQVAEVAEQHGEAAGWVQAWLQLKQVFLGGALLSAVAIAALAGFGWALRIEAYHLAVLAVLIAFSCYVTEVGRIVFQGLRRTALVGAFGLVWMTSRFFIVTGFVYWTASVWGALLGLLVSGPLVFLPVLLTILKRRFGSALASSVRLRQMDRRQLVEFVTFSLAFCLFVGFSYLDIGLAYLKFEPEVLGQYSASNVIPKGILTFALPILQVAVPAIAAKRVAEQVDPSIVKKGVAVTLAVAGTACLIAYLSEPVLCGGIGIAGCRDGLMDVLLLSVLPLCLLRLAITVEFSTGARNLVGKLGVMVLLVAALLFATTQSPQDLARNYAVATNGLLIVYLLFAMGPRLLERWTQAR